MSWLSMAVCNGKQKGAMKFLKIGESKNDFFID